MNNTEAYLEIQARLTEDQKRALLDRVLRVNPHLRGAHVADVLEICDETDALLDLREPFLETHGQWLGDRTMVRVASIVAALIQPDNMLPLVEELMAKGSQ